MEFHVEILLNFLVEAVRSPCLRKEAKRHGLTETVELQTAASTSIHNGGVMDDSHRNITLFRANPEVRVCGCSTILGFVYLFTQRHLQRRGRRYCRQQRCPGSSLHSIQRGHGQRQSPSFRRTPPTIQHI